MLSATHTPTQDQIGHTSVYSNGRSRVSTLVTYQASYLHGKCYGSKNEATFCIYPPILEKYRYLIHVNCPLAKKSPAANTQHQLEIKGNEFDSLGVRCELKNPCSMRRAALFRHLPSLYGPVPGSAQYSDCHIISHQGLSSNRQLGAPSLSHH